MLAIHEACGLICIVPPDAADLTALQAVWSASQDGDEPAGRPHIGWWSIPTWATASRILVEENRVKRCRLDPRMERQTCSRFVLHSVPSHRLWERRRQDEITHQPARHAR